MYIFLFLVEELYRELNYHVFPYVVLRYSPDFLVMVIQFTI